jgi:hypothetical protein
LNDTRPDLFILGKLRKKYPNIKSVKVPYLSSIYMVNLTMSLDQNGTVEEDTFMEQISDSNAEQGPTQNATVVEEIGRRRMGSETGSGTETEHGELHPVEARLNISLDISVLDGFDLTSFLMDTSELIPDFKYLRDNPNARLRTLTFFPDRQLMFPLSEPFSGVLHPFFRMSRMLLNEVTTFRCNVGRGDHTHITRLCSVMKNLRVFDFVSRDPVDLLNSYNCLALGGMKNLERLSLSCSPVDWIHIQIPLRITQKLRVVRCDFEEVLLPSDRYQRTPRLDWWFRNYLIFLILEVLFITDVYRAWRSIAFDTIDIQQLIRYFDDHLPVACKVRLICCPSHTPDFLDQETVDGHPNANVSESELCHKIAALEATLESYRRAARSTVEQVPLSEALPGWTALGATTS